RRARRAVAARQGVHAGGAGGRRRRPPRRLAASGGAVTGLGARRLARRLARRPPHEVVHDRRVVGVDDRKAAWLIALPAHGEAGIVHVGAVGEEGVGAALHALRLGLLLLIHQRAPGPAVVE